MRKSLLTIAVMSALASQVAFADEAAAPAAAAAPTPTWTFPASATLVSDYIWRGQTQTWGNPAAQFGIEADHASGFYAGFWGSNVSSHWLPNASLETDWSVGFRNTFATDFKYDLGAVYVWYPDGDFAKSAASGGVGSVLPYNKSKLNTAELYASLGWKWFTVKAGANPTKFYGWNTNNSGVTGPDVAYPHGSFAGDINAGVTGDTKWSHYFMASASYDLPMGLNVAGEVGRQVIENSTGLDWTWYKVGVTKTFADTWALNAFYTGTTGSSAYKNFLTFDGTTDTKDIDSKKVVVGITKSF